MSGKGSPDRDLQATGPKGTGPKKAVAPLQTLDGTWKVPTATSTYLCIVIHPYRAVPSRSSSLVTLSLMSFDAHV